MAVSGKWFLYSGEKNPGSPISEVSAIRKVWPRSSLNLRAATGLNVPLTIGNSGNIDIHLRLPFVPEIKFDPGHS